MIRFKGFSHTPVIFLAKQPNAGRKEHTDYHGAGWYFYCEDWCSIEGPYASRMEAVAELRQYCEELENYEWEEV